jgi:hypothetical protein
VRLGFIKRQQKEDGGEGKQRRRRRGGGEEREEGTAKEVGQDRDPEWGTWGVEANEEKDKDTTGNEMAGVCARQAKTRKGVMKTKASAGVGKHKRGINEGGAKGLTRGYPDLYKQK